MAENYSDFKEDPVSESDKELTAFVIDHCDFGGL